MRQTKKVQGKICLHKLTISLTGEKVRHRMFVGRLEIRATYGYNSESEARDFFDSFDEKKANEFEEIALNIAEAEKQKKE